MKEFGRKRKQKRKQQDPLPHARNTSACRAYCELPVGKRGGRPGARKKNIEVARNWWVAVEGLFQNVGDGKAMPDEEIASHKS